RSLPEQRIAAVLAETKPAAVISDGGVASPYPLVRLDQVAASAKRFTPHPSSPDDAAYIPFTSGSTRPPQGVGLTQGNLACFLAAYRKRVGLSPSDRIAAITTISFDVSIVELLLPLVMGGTVQLFPRETARDPALLARSIRESKINVLQGTPPTF